MYVCLFAALTFSFALPACFCTVFAINAPLLSAIFFTLLKKRWLCYFSPQNTNFNFETDVTSFHNEPQPKRTNGSAEKHWRLDTKLRAEHKLPHFHRASPIGSTVHALAYFTCWYSRTKVKIDEWKKSNRLKIHLKLILGYWVEKLL